MKSRTRAFCPYLLMMVIAFCVTLPAWVSPPMLHSSFWIDIVWSEQFTEQLRNGFLYPRWLPRSFGGLGAPVFYFYAPLSFYHAGIFGLIGFSTYEAILLAFGSAILASGATMYWWLRDRGAKHALPAACLYMIGPYHIVDFYYRGAVAESLAFVFLPLLALGLARAAEKRSIGLLALSYAALIMSHLPLALLGSVLFILPYGAWLVWRNPVCLPRLVSGIGLGIGISCIYLIPALSLQDHIASDILWGVSYLRPENWLPLLPWRWPNPRTALFFTIVTATLVPAAVAMLIRGRSFWTIYSAFVLAVILGCVPIFWSLPLIEKVQFSWRALVLAEFGVATAIGLSPLAPKWKLLLAGPMLAISLSMMRPIYLDDNLPLATLRTEHPDVFEYLPKGAPREDGLVSQWAFAIANEIGGDTRTGDMTTARRFFFPSWIVTCPHGAAETFPHPTTSLLSYRGENCVAQLGYTPAEKLGALSSLLSLLILIASSRLSRRSASTTAPAVGRRSRFAEQPAGG